MAQQLVAELFPKTFVITITGEMVKRYATVSRDDNPIHVSKNAAKQAGFKERVIHGMLTMAITTKLVSPLLGKTWMIQSFTSKFLSPLYVNDQLTVIGSVLFHHDDVLCIKVSCQNQNKQMIIKGKLTLNGIKGL